MIFQNIANRSLSPITILSVADNKCPFLETYLTADIRNGNEFDYIFSCGDLSINYLTNIADSINNIIYYIEGNHKFLDEEKIQELKKKHLYVNDSIPGCKNIMLTPVVTPDYIFCGFGGSARYNDEPSQYSEEEMQNFVNITLRKIKLIRIKEFFFRQKRREILCISHAPIQGCGDGEDNAHRGFKAFRNFIETAKPVLWLYGHVHLKSFHELVTFQYDETLILNSYEFKKIIIESSGALRVETNLYQNK